MPQSTFIRPHLDVRNFSEDFTAEAHAGFTSTRRAHDGTPQTGWPQNPQHVPSIGLSLLEKGEGKHRCSVVSSRTNQGNNTDSSANGGMDEARFDGLIRWLINHAQINGRLAFILFMTPCRPCFPNLPIVAFKGCFPWLPILVHGIARFGVGKTSLGASPTQNEADTSARPGILR